MENPNEQKLGAQREEIESMSFRYDTRHLSGQQQAIISQRDKSEKERKKAAAKKKLEEEAEAKTEAEKE